MRDPWDRDIFWIGGGSITWTGEADSDFRAIQDGYISITPLHLDLTQLQHARISGELVAGSVDGAMGGARRRLVELLREKGIRDLAVLRAFDLTPRHAFVPTGVRHRAYEDAPLPIGSGQTISQPCIHARYLELLALKGERAGARDRHRAPATRRCSSRISSRRSSPSSAFRRSTPWRATPSTSAGAKNVSMLLGDGTVGWREYAPYDAILVSAGGPTVPQPLVEQLADGGRMLVPVGRNGGADAQARARKRGGRSRRRDVAPGAVRAPARHARMGAAIGARRCTFGSAAACRASASVGSFAKRRAASVSVAGSPTSPGGEVEVAAGGEDSSLERLARARSRVGPIGRGGRPSVEDIAGEITPPLPYPFTIHR